MKKLKKILAFHLAFSLCFGYLPTVVYAEEGQGHMECEHHQVHTAECGYSEGMEGSPCNHKCTLESGCVINVNTEENNTKEEGEVSDNSIQDNSTQDHSIQLEVVCTHTEHDENCGYLEAVEGSECTYFCRVCQIQNLMNQLPDEVNENNQAEVEKMLSEIDNLKSGLTDQETGLLHIEKYENVSNMLANILNEAALPLEAAPKVKLTSVAPMLATTANSKEVVYTSFNDGSSPAGSGTIDNPYNYFVSALNAVADGGKIIIIDDAIITAQDGLDQNNSDIMPYIINKNVTIESGNNNTTYLSVAPGGLILGGNVTFKNVQISLLNNIKNAVFANGHRLELINSGSSAGTRKVHIFAGGVGGSKAVAGSHSQIIIDDTSSSFGNIYTGAMLASYDKPVSVTISNIARGEIGKIYGSGAPQGFYDESFILSGIEPEDPVASPDAYPSTGTISVTINGTGVTEINGKASSTNKINVSIDTKTSYLFTNFILNEVGKFTVLNGKVAPTALSTETSFHIGSLGVLNLSEIMKNSYGIYEAMNLSGDAGGKLVFGKDYQLVLFGDFTGSLEFQTDTQQYGDESKSGIVNDNQTYIDVAGNSTGSITFKPHADNSNIELVNKNGDWITQTIGSSGGDVAVEDTLIKTLSVEQNSRTHNIKREGLYNGNNLTVKIQYTTNEIGSKLFENFPLNYVITRAGKMYNLSAEQEENNYIVKSDELNLKFTHVEGNPADDDSYYGGEIYIESINETKLLSGNYNIKLVVPKEHMIDNLEFSTFIELMIDYESPSQPQNLKINNITDSSVNLSWDTPSDLGGATEDEIVYEVYKDGQKEVETEDKTVFISGLNSKSPYKFKVRAKVKDVQDIVGYYTSEIEAVTLEEQAPSVHEHNPTGWDYDDNTHWKKCDCNERVEEATHSTENTAWSKDENIHWKTCECGKVLEESGHTAKDNIWYRDAEYHWKECECGERIDLRNHTPGPEATETTPQTCTQCGYEIAPVLNHRHSWSDWISNGDNTHTRTCIKDSNHKETLSCNGGVATCKDLAICKDCKVGYGLLDKTNHIGGTYLDGKKEPTQETDGYTGDTKCDSCDEIITKGSAVKYQGSQEKPGTNPGQGEGSQEKPGTNPGQGEGSQEKPGTNPGQGEGSQEKPGTNPGQGEGSQEKPGTNPGQVTDNQNNQQANNGNMGQTGNSSSSPQAASSSITSSVHQNRREQSTQNKEATTSQVVQNHIVQNGDSLSKIAKRYGCTVGELVEANRDLIKNPNLIHIGWKLQIPVREAGIMNGNSTAATMFTPPDNRPIITYIIKRGDSLWKIARLNGCSIEDLIAFNTDTIRNPNLIIAGKELRIPQN